MSRSLRAITAVILTVLIFIGADAACVAENNQNLSLLPQGQNISLDHREPAHEHGGSVSDDSGGDHCIQFKLLFEQPSLDRNTTLNEIEYESHRTALSGSGAQLIHRPPIRVA